MSGCFDDIVALLNAARECLHNSSCLLVVFRLLSDGGIDVVAALDVLPTTETTVATTATTTAAARGTNEYHGGTPPLATVRDCLLVLGV